MSKRFLTVAVAALTAAPVYAAENEQAASTDAQQHAREVVALRGIVPQEPILTGAEGATDSGGAGVLRSALYGGLIGAAIGAAVGLIEGGNYGRDIGIGAGVGVLAGAALGAAGVFDRSGPYPATDGLASTDRDTVIRPHTVALAGRF